MSENQTVTMDAILEKARELGSMIARHPAAAKYREAVSALESDRDAQHLLTDYNRHIRTISEKESTGQPIEVEDKHKLRDFQTRVAMNPSLSRLQMAEMDYLDLMRKVESAMSESASSSP